MLGYDLMLVMAKKPYSRVSIMLREVGSGCCNACVSVMGGLCLEVLLHGDVNICTWVL